MLTKDLKTTEEIQNELQKEDLIAYTALLYESTIPLIRRKIQQGYSLKELDAAFDIGYDLSN